MFYGNRSILSIILLNFNSIGTCIRHNIIIIINPINFGSDY